MMGLLTTMLAGALADGACPEGWASYSNPATNFTTCFKAVCAPLDWNAAYAQCKDHGAELAKITDGATNDFVRKLLPDSTPFWFGLNGQNVAEGSWRWNQEPYVAAPTYLNWQKNEPNNYDGDEDCGFVGYCQTSDSKWYDGPCETRFPYVCELTDARGGITATTTTYPTTNTTTTVPTTETPATWTTDGFDGTASCPEPADYDAGACYWWIWVLAMIVVGCCCCCCALGLCYFYHIRQSQGRRAAAANQVAAPPIAGSSLFNAPPPPPTYPGALASINGDDDVALIQPDWGSEPPSYPSQQRQQPPVYPQ